MSHILEIPASSTGRLDGRHVLVTGAASGIGQATAELFVRNGAKVALLDVDAKQLVQVASTIGGIPFVVDLLDIKKVSSITAEVREQLGGLDGLVNCAGVSIIKPFDGITLDDWQRSLGVNLTACFVLCQAALSHLRASKGTIVNVASGVGLLPDTPNLSAYAASKGGLIAFSKALAAELAPEVRVNAICPGLTATPMTKHILESGVSATSRYALRRPAQPLEIANGILFLTSHESSFVTGCTLSVDGGRIFH